MRSLRAVRPEPAAAVVVHDDGRVTITVTREQFLVLETFAAQPSWKRASREVAKVLRRVGV